MRILGAGIVAAAVGAVAWAQTPPPIAPEPTEEVVSETGETVSLRALDKLTGEIASHEGQVGGSIEIWRLRVEVKTCTRRTSRRSPESSAFLQIYDQKYEPARLSFSGWMFASSPALSAMDHPRYDVWVLSCNTS